MSVSAHPPRLPSSSYKLCPLESLIVADYRGFPEDMPAATTPLIKKFDNMWKNEESKKKTKENRKFEKSKNPKSQRIFKIMYIVIYRI